MTQQSATLPTVPDSREDWVLTRPFLLRVAGLPARTAVRLRFPEAVRWAEELLALDEELDLRRAAVGDALSAAIANNPDEGLRRGLLELRRDVFNSRLPRDVPLTRRLAAGLGTEARHATLDWLDVRIRREGHRDTGDAILADELHTRREYLREVVRDPRLRHGLLLASPSLDRYVPTYLEAPPAPLAKRARRIERSLLEYVFRTTCKTSPFSSLTTVALGHFDEKASWALAAQGLEGAPRSHVRINVAALARIADAVLRDPAKRADLPVWVTTGVTADSDRIRYIRRVRSAGDDASAVSFDSLQEDLFYLQRGTVLTEVLALLEEQPHLRIGELAAHLHAADPLHRDPVEVDTYLWHLLRLGLLTVPLLGVDIHSRDPLRTFRDGIAQVRRPWADGLAERLDAVSNHISAYPEGDLETRRRLLGVIREELLRSQRDLGAVDAATPQTVVYEDVCLPHAQVTAELETWQQGLLPDLQQLSRILPLFDVMLPHRLALKGFFLARYGRGGRCDDVLAFVREFQRDFHDQFARTTSRQRTFRDDGEFVPLDNWLRLPEIDALNAARTVLVQRMRLAYADLPADATELVLDDAFIEAVAAALPRTGNLIEPRSFFLQVADDGGHPLGVLNRSYSGLTFLFSRFAHCFQDAGSVEQGIVADLRAALQEVQPPGTVFAELTGGYDTTNLNLHPAVTDHELVCPGETSSRPSTAQLPVDDLAIVHDEEGDRLVLRADRLDADVIPVYLGFLLPMALPEVQRTLLLFSYSNAAPLDFWGGTDRPLQGNTIGGHPRLRYRNLVLVRRMWKMHPDYLPARGDAAGEAGWFFAWQRWRQHNGLPRRVFATIDTAPLGEQAGGDKARGQPIKPQYVDFDSYFSLLLLEASVRGAQRRVVMFEMLPDVDQLWLRSKDGDYVAEQTVEITGRTR